LEESRIVARKKNPIELQKLSKDTNPRLVELLAEITENADANGARSSAKPTWGRRFNASGKLKQTAPRIRLSYNK
jgi:hypothetical protein